MTKLQQDPLTFGQDYEYDNKIHKHHKGHKKDEEASQRKITSTRVDKELPKNGIQTSKYTNLNFVPKNLMEQFSKLANVYFLLFGFIQMIDSITISDGLPTIYLPLATIVLITAAKDYYEDYKRKRSDREENESKTMVYNCETHKFEQKMWYQLRVGDIVFVKKDEFFPADLLVLNTSEPKGLAYIETKGLDGETNLKQKQCQKDIYQYFLETASGNLIDENQKNQGISDESIFQKKLIFGYEQPNPFLNKFNGYVELPGLSDQVSIDNKNFLLRGCSLKNTKYIYGLVANTGHDTKIQKNSFKARAKRSRLENVMNEQVILIFVIQVILCLACGIVYLNVEDEDTQPYLEYEDQEKFTILAQKFGNWILIFGNFVPISLLVTLEFVKLFQGIFIEMDNAQIDDASLKQANWHGMTYYYMNEKGEKEKVKTAVQSSNLNEELGQIEYVFSDKTGTLTCNIMKFKNISINGVSYGEIPEDDPAFISDDSQQNEFPSVTNVNFRDRNLIDIYRNPSHPEHQNIRDVLLFLSLTHTILLSEDPDPKNPGKTIMKYNASSPDELALVNFAKFCGVEYCGTDENDNAIIKFNDGNNETTEVIEVLHIFEFDSTRKRQSVVIRDPKSKKVKILTKGADSVILQLSNRGESKSVDKLSDHLEQYSLIGLRTLLLSQREIDEQYYNTWKAKYNIASTAIENRDKKMSECQAELEQDLIIIGGTAIEDQLQDEVGLSIAALKKAGIKVWVLTGDKVETARNIGYSCKLLTKTMKQYRVDLKTDEALDKALGRKRVIEQLDEVIEKMQEANKSYQQQNNGNDDMNNALIITGDALIHGLNPDIAVKIIEITKYCEAVLCCRVSPKQKQEVVTLVRKFNPKVSTLAIGDGANDVNMITAAHVGIGIKGLEGYQAARASDYAIGEFKLLRRLLFVHGREAYRRNSRLVCYNFYKNIMIVVPQFWYGLYNFFSGTTLYDPFLYQFYNVFYTSMPIIIYAVFDLEFNPIVLQNNLTNYYLPGIKHALFSKAVFWKWFFLGFLQAALLLMNSVYTISNNFVNEDGHNLNFWALGFMVYGLVVVLVNIKVLIISFDHTFISLFFNFGSMLLYLVSFLVLSTISSSEAFNVFKISFESGAFHLGNLLTIFMVSFMIDYAVERYDRCQATVDRTDESAADTKYKINNSKSNQIAPSPQLNRDQDVYSHNNQQAGDQIQVDIQKKQPSSIPSNNSHINNHEQENDEYKKLV